jgi:hypothetical protein
MTSAANPQSYGPANSSPWGQTPHWGDRPSHPGWGPPWAWCGFPKPLAIALTIVGFIIWWPVGLAILFYLLGSGAMGCRSFRRRHATEGWQHHPWGSGPWTGWKSWCGGERQSRSSGNRAFDEYRAETLRRLEEEQKEFAAFLERLRFAKDKGEFDQFMTERRERPVPPEAPEPSAG